MARSTPTPSSHPTKALADPNPKIISRALGARQWVGPAPLHPYRTRVKNEKNRKNPSNEYISDFIRIGLLVTLWKLEVVLRPYWLVCTRFTAITSCCKYLKLHVIGFRNFTPATTSHYKYPSWPPSHFFQLSPSNQKNYDGCYLHIVPFFFELDLRFGRHREPFSQVLQILLASIRRANMLRI